jgi:hypothetical protein
MAHAHYTVSLRQLSLREPIGTKIEMDYCELPALFFPLDRLRKSQLELECGLQQLAVDLQPAQLDRRCEPKPHSRHRVIVRVKTTALCPRFASSRVVSVALRVCSSDKERR